MPATNHLDEALTHLDQEQLRELLRRLVEHDPALRQHIQDEIDRLTAGPVAAPQLKEVPRPPAALDRNAIRRSMHSALFPSGWRPSSGWHVFSMGDEASSLLAQAWSFIKADDGRTALEMLHVMTEEVLQNWQEVMEDEGETLMWVQDELGPAWIEAALSAELTPNERDGWIAALDSWAAELADYVDDATFRAALLALDEGWDDPDLQQTLQGRAAAPDIVHNNESRVRYLLTRARLNVLERRGRLDEYLNLARAEGEVRRYTTMLAQLGRAGEAADYGLAHLQQTQDALQLAKALREGSHLDRALRVAEHGLTLEGQKAELATWLADLAATMGNQKLAVRAAMVACEEEQSLATYLRVQELAREEWPERREQLLDHMRRTRAFFPLGPIQIFLHEGLIDDAIALVDRDTYASAHLIEPVADAAIHSHPDWVIAASRRQAEPIMDRGKADKYGVAIQWLTKAREAHRAAGRQDDWNAYLDSLLTEHGRKYKLVPMLKTLQW